MGNKKAIAIVYTDTHLEKEEHIDLNIGVVNSITRKAAELDEEEIMFCHAGDVFTDRRKITLDENLLPFNDILDSFNKYNITLNVIPGNHDKSSQIRDESYLDIYKHHPAMELHKTPTVTRRGKFLFCFLPYYLEKDGTYNKKLESISRQLSRLKREDDKVILITHVAINGVMNNDGSRVEGNVEFSHFSQFDLVLVGHYHDRQEFKKGGTRIVYIGSAYQRNFGENSDKGFAIIYDDLSVEYVKTKFPHYYKESFILPQDYKKMKIKIIHYQKRFERGETDFFVRFVVKGEREDLIKVDVDSLKKYRISVVKETNTMLKNIENADKGEVYVYTNSKIRESFADFCKENKISKNKVSFGMKKLEKYV